MGVGGCPPNKKRKENRKKRGVRKKLKIKGKSNKRIQSKEETKWRTQRNK